MWMQLRWIREHSFSKQQVDRILAASILNNLIPDVVSPSNLCCICLNLKLKSSIFLREIESFLKATTADYTAILQ